MSIEGFEKLEAIKVFESDFNEVRTSVPVVGKVSYDFTDSFDNKIARLSTSSEGMEVDGVQVRMKRIFKYQDVSLDLYHNIDNSAVDSIKRQLYIDMLEDLSKYILFGLEEDGQLMFEGILDEGDNDTPMNINTIGEGLIDSETIITPTTEIIMPDSDYNAIIDYSTMSAIESNMLSEWGQVKLFGLDVHKLKEDEKYKGLIIDLDRDYLLLINDLGVTFRDVIDYEAGVVHFTVEGYFSGGRKNTNHTIKF